ncbi:hypothetical protein JNO48_12390 [Clostridiales bacterium]|nr:hypothetical protein JNO48_12390 [Clostridiales bacterium]
MHLRIGRQQCERDITICRNTTVGTPENVCHVICEGGHRFYAADAWPVFDEVTGWR